MPNLGGLISNTYVGAPVAITQSPAPLFGYVLSAAIAHLVVCKT